MKVNEKPPYEAYEPYEPYEPYERYRQPLKRQPKRRNAPLLLLVTVLAFAGAAAGTWFMNRYGRQDAGTPYASTTSVTLQTVTATSRTDDEIISGGTVVERVAAIGKQSIVEVTTESKNTHPYFGSYVTSGAGSGVILSAEGYIATNDHVISGSDSICVRLPDGQLLEAALVGTDAQTDLAVLKVEATGLQPVTFADSDAVVVGELAVAIGNPLGTLGGTVTEGIISARDREIIIGGEAMVLLQTSAAISPGNSGGGLFDQNGYLVGVVNAKSGEENVEGIGFAIPANTAKTVLAALMENGYVPGRPILGIEAATVSSFDALYRYNTSRPGIYVSDALSSSALMRGDRIIAVENTEIASVAELKSIIGQGEVGDILTLTIVRNGRQTQIETPLLERGAQGTDSYI